MNKLLATTALTAAVCFGGTALADSLTPATFSATIGVGGSTSITGKTGVITAGAPTTAQADVLFVVDTTGSMGAAISQINSTFASVVSSLSGLGDIATGAAQFKDKTNSPSDPFDYSLTQAITTNATLTSNALSGYTASGGGDTPEQGLYALTQAADSSTGWRTGSKKIVVITGDAPSHSSPSHGIAAGGVGVTSTASTLFAAGVTVEAVDANPITHGDGGLDAYGQFDNSTGIFAHSVAGGFTSSFPTGGALTTLLTNLIGSAFSTYSDVSLALVGPAPTNCSVSLPANFSGSFDRSSTNTFNFGNVGVTGLSAGTCNFTIALEADGAILATESDSILVSAAPEPASAALVGGGLLALAAVRRRRKKS